MIGSPCARGLAATRSSNGPGEVLPATREVRWPCVVRCRQRASEADTRGSEAAAALSTAAPIRRHARSTAVCGGARGWCRPRQRGWWPALTGSEARDGNDPFSPNAATRSFFVLDNLLDGVCLRLGFLCFPSLSSINTVSRQQKLINRNIK